MFRTRSWKTYSTGRHVGEWVLGWDMSIGQRVSNIFVIFPLGGRAVVICHGSQAAGKQMVGECRKELF